MTRMREQGLYTPDIARLVRGANAGDGRRGSAWRIGTPGSSGPAPRNSSGLPNFREHPRARDHGVHGGRIVSCLVKGVPRQGCS